MKTIMMMITCWIVQNGEIHKAWFIEQEATLQTCLTMNRLFANGGKAAVVTVRCGNFYDPLD